MGAQKTTVRAGKSAIGKRMSAADAGKLTEAPELTPVERFLIKGFQRDRADLLEGGNRFGREAIDAVRVSKRILANSEHLRKESRNSEADFARRILWQYDQAQCAIADGRADDAAMWALRLGKTIAHAALTLKNSKPGRPKGSLVKGEEQILEVIEEDLAAGKDGQPTARKILEFQGISAETSSLAKDLTSKARRRLNSK